MALASDLTAPSRLPASSRNRLPRGRRRPERARLDPRSSTAGNQEVLFRRHQRDGDMSARRQLIERYLPLARSLARRYERRGESFDDLVQVASLGLVKAIDRFDPDRGLSFTSYAVPTMLGELRRYFRDSGWALHVPREIQERVLKVNAALERLSGELGRSPSPQQVADELDLPVEDVLEAMAANAAYEASSLDTPLASRDDAGQSIAETLGEEDERFELVEGRVSIGPALQALPERERIILHLRFVEDLKQSEIAERIGVSQMHVSRLIRRALEAAHVAALRAA